MAKWWKIPSMVLSFLLIAAVRVYQKTLSPIVGRSCIYQPTCSNYFIQAVQKYGPIKGSLKGLWRICRCHPWAKGGEDSP